MTDKILIQFSQAVMVLAIIVSVLLAIIEWSIVWGGLSVFVVICLVCSLLVSKDMQYDRKDH